MLKLRHFHFQIANCYVLPSTLFTAPLAASLKTSKQRFQTANFEGRRSRRWFDEGNEFSSCHQYKHNFQGRDPWSSGYGRRLKFRRSCVWIMVLYTGWTFFHISDTWIQALAIFIKNYMFSVNCYNKIRKPNRKESGDSPFLKILTLTKFCNGLV